MAKSHHLDTKAKQAWKAAHELVNNQNALQNAVTMGRGSKNADALATDLLQPEKSR